MKVRQANRADSLQIAILNRAVQEPHAAAEPLFFKSEPDIAQVIAFFEELLADPDNRIFIIEVEGRAAGYLYLQIMRRPENVFMHAYNMAYIHHIAVLKEKQGGGLGSILMEAACDLAREEDIQMVALDTWSFNTAAHGFFRRRGFETFNLRMKKRMMDEG